MRTLWQAGKEWTNDNASFLGAALAYYSLFSIAPLLLIAVTIAGFALGEAAAQGRVFDFLKDYVGEDGARAVQQLVVASAKPGFGSWTSLVATAILLYAALNLFRQLKTGLGLVWKLPPMPRSGLTAFIYDTFLALILVLFTGIFIVFLTVASMVNAFLADLPLLSAFGPWAWRGLDFGAVVTLQVLILGLTYRFLSEGRIKLRHVWGGAVAASLLLYLGKSLFSLYLGYTNFNSLYGAAGSIVVFLVWIYYSAQIVFFGAEVIKVRIGQSQMPTQ